MHRQFDPFQYQLNFNSNNSHSPAKGNIKKSPKTISVLITPTTNVHSIAKKLCLENKLSANLVNILAMSIQKEVEKQVQEKEKEMESLNNYSSVSSNFSQQSRSKRFKNNFCSSLHESTQEDASNVSSFIKNDFVLDPSSINSSDQEEYSFRPATYMKMLDTANDEQDNKNVSLNEFAEQNHSSTNLSTKKSINYSEKSVIVKKDRNVFDNLYKHSKALEWKKDLQREKSFEKYVFKPQMNPMSKKIIQMKKQSNPEDSRDNSINKQQNTNKSPSFLDKSRSKQRVSPNQTPKSTKKQLISQKQNVLPIYERGMIYRQKSQQKLFEMKKKQIINEFKGCTFKPKLNINSNEPTTRTKTPQSSFSILQ